MPLYLGVLFVFRKLHLLSYLASLRLIQYLAKRSHLVCLLSSVMYMKYFSVGAWLCRRGCNMPSPPNSGGKYSVLRFIGSILLSSHRNVKICFSIAVRAHFGMCKRLAKNQICDSASVLMIIALPLSESVLYLNLDSVFVSLVIVIRQL